MERRIRAIQTILDPQTAALCLSAPSCRYLSGFEYTDGGVLITADQAFLLTDSRYTEAAVEAVTHMTVVTCNGLFSSLKQLLEQYGVTRLLTEQTVTLRELSGLQKLSVDLVTDATLQDAVDAARLVKDEAELACLRRAQEITEQGFSHILPYIRAGITERDIALELEFFMRKNGADGVSFDSIAVSGANGSRPHGVPTDKKVCSGDFITLDFGALYRGYHADMTRTVAVGDITPRQRLVYETVLQAQRAALSVIRAGVPCADADAAARTVIAQAGFGEYFGHGLGHGVGVEIHELPTLSPRAKNAKLKAGSVVTVEPGIYLPGECGVRIEDMVLVTENGCENLTKSPKELIIL